MEEYVQIATTVATAEEAATIAHMLVEKRLAACVQVLGPMSSCYRWQGKIERADEHLCLIKSKKDLFAEIEEAIRSVHSYEVPEIIALPICAGSREYLGWLASELRGPA